MVAEQVGTVRDRYRRSHADDPRHGAVPSRGCGTDLRVGARARGYGYLAETQLGIGGSRYSAAPAVIPAPAATNTTRAPIGRGLSPFWTGAASDAVCIFSSWATMMRSGATSSCLASAARYPRRAGAATMTSMSDSVSAESRRQ